MKLGGKEVEDIIAGHTRAEYRAAELRVLRFWMKRELSDGGKLSEETVSEHLRQIVRVGVAMEFHCRKPSVSNRRVAVHKRTTKTVAVRKSKKTNRKA